MDAVLLSDHQSFAACNQNWTLVNGLAHHQASGNLLSIHGSIFGAPPSSSSSFSSLGPSRSSSFSSFSSWSSGSQSPRLQQPPLLPLPSAAMPAFSTTRPPTRANRKAGRSTRHSGEEPKKAPAASSTTKRKPSRPPMMKDDGRKTAPSNPAIVPNEMGNTALGASTGGEMEDICGSIFSISPPPSSLPIPKFTLRPKIRCKAEAAVANLGTADDLRRLLRLE